MVACPLCVLGVPEEEHTPERWQALTDEERAFISHFNRKNPGVIVQMPPPEEKVWRKVLVDCLLDARKSPDPSTQNAAVLCWERNGQIYPIVSTMAVNKFPAGVAYTDERWERPLKYSIIEHAERNSIFAAASRGIPTQGLTMVCPWAACADCARAIIQSGITRLVTLAPVQGDTNGRWDASISLAMAMLEEVGVEIVYIDGPLNAGAKVRRDGKLIEF